MNTLYRSQVKRLFDLVLTIGSAPAWVPLMGVLALIVKAQAWSEPVLFTQMRPGLDGELFELRKFRTMNSRVDDGGVLLPDDQRLNRFGRLLRSTSLDEIPELMNVLAGHMSLVGPRPLLVEYLPLYSERHARRQSLRPGLTGWAQINGRNNVTWEEKFEMDVWYVDNMSVLLDIRILFQTVDRMVRRSDISQADHATTTAFSGYDEPSIADIACDTDA